MDDENKKVGLNLQPNEVVGFRISPDQYNWTVVKFKRHGKDSKHAGKEYKESMAYLKNLETAVGWIFNHVSAMEGKKLQEEHFNATGEMASLEKLVEAFKVGKQEALNALHELELELQEIGYDVKGNALNRAMLKKMNKDLEENSESPSDSEEE